MQGSILPAGVCEFISWQEMNSHTEQEKAERPKDRTANDTPDAGDSQPGGKLLLRSPFLARKVCDELV